MAANLRLLLLSTALACAPASAGDADGNFATKGAGTRSCADFTAAIDDADPALGLFAGYVAGYVSAYNEHRADTFDLLPWQRIETVMLILARRCRQLPDGSFARAVSELANYFEGDRLSKMAPLQTIGSGEHRLELYAPVVQEVRAALRERGYATDDLYAALDRFRRDQQLPPTMDNLQTALLRLLYDRPGA